MVSVYPSFLLLCILRYFKEFQSLDENAEESVDLFAKNFRLEGLP